MERYYLALSFSGDIWKIEEEIVNILGYSHGSGCGLGYRDLSYYFNHKGSLHAAVRKIRRMPRRIKCQAWENNPIKAPSDEVGYYDQKEISLRGIK